MKHHLPLIAAFDRTIPTEIKFHPDRAIARLKNMWRDLQAGLCQTSTSSITSHEVRHEDVYWFVALR